MQIRHNHLCSISHSTSNITASFFTIALPMLLTNVLFRSAVEDNSMLKERFSIPRTITSSLAKFGNPTVTDFGQSHWDCE